MPSLQPKPFYGFAPVHFPEKSKLDSLHASKEELETIAQLFQQYNRESHLSLEKEATKKELTENFEKPYQFIHIASHTHANLKYPLSSSIACGDSSIQIGTLYNSQVKTDLLVLSSCKSGVGKLVEGEGMQGLNKNFIMEGVPNIVLLCGKPMMKPPKIS